MRGIITPHGNGYLIEFIGLDYDAPGRIVFVSDLSIQTPGTGKSISIKDVVKYTTSVVKNTSADDL